MKNFRPRSFTRGHAALIIVLSLTFLVLFSISRSSAQQEDPGPTLHDGGYSPARMRSENFQGPFDYEVFLQRIKNGEFPFDGGEVDVVSPSNSLTNNNAGSSGTAF